MPWPYSGAGHTLGQTVMSNLSSRPSPWSTTCPMGPGTLETGRSRQLLLYSTVIFIIYRCCLPGELISGAVLLSGLCGYPMALLYEKLSFVICYILATSLLFQTSLLLYVATHYTDFFSSQPALLIFCYVLYGKSTCQCFDDMGQLAYFTKMRRVKNLWWQVSKLCNCHTAKYNNNAGNFWLWSSDANSLYLSYRWCIFGETYEGYSLCILLLGYGGNISPMG